MLDLKTIIIGYFAFNLLIAFVMEVGERRDRNRFKGLDFCPPGHGKSMPAFPDLASTFLMCVMGGFLSGYARRRRNVPGFSWLAGVLLVILLAAGCGTTTQPLRVGANVWPGYEPLFMARNLGYSDDQTVQLITLPSAAEVMRAYRNHAIDVAALTADEALQVAEMLPGQTIVLVCDFSQYRITCYQRTAKAAKYAKKIFMIFASRHSCGIFIRKAS